MDKLRVGIVGASGYAGGELCRLLRLHPHVSLSYVTSGTYAGHKLDAALPGLRGTGLVCEVFDAAACAAASDFVFLAGEAGMAMQVAPILLEQDKLVVDLSADFRLASSAEYETWYGKPHTASHLLAEAAYGLPELGQDWIKDARLTANPGCHVTAAVLALAPLVRAMAIDPATIVINSLSGVSGAGRAKFGLDYHFSEVNESIKPYGVGGIHRHTPEIEQALKSIEHSPALGKPLSVMSSTDDILALQAAVQAFADVKVNFTPHLVPVTRGILSTVSASLAPPELGAGEASVPALYADYYKDAPFVTILDEGQFPATKHVTGTNNCHIGLAVDKRTNRVIIVSAIDNLGKGAAGQAVQNMNLMCGFAETDGLTGGALWP